MIREELTEKILDIKREKDWTWKYICDEIGGVSDVMIVGALLGQMKLVKPLAAKAPANCTTMYPGTSDQRKRPATAKASVTAGFKCAPLMSPKVWIIAITTKPKVSATPTWPITPPCA